MARWIPIHRTRPKSGQYVMYYGPQAGQGIAQYIESNRGYYFQINTEYVRGIVTHWQELPKPPRSATKRIL